MVTYQVLPPLTEAEYAALKADIAERGVEVPVVYDDAGNVLDGHHRVRACEELGITGWPRLVRAGLSGTQKRAYARSLNAARRHLKCRPEARPMVHSRRGARALGVRARGWLDETSTLEVEERT